MSHGEADHGGLVGAPGPSWPSWSLADGPLRRWGARNAVRARAPRSREQPDPAQHTCNRGPAPLDRHAKTNGASQQPTVVRGSLQGVGNARSGNRCGRVAEEPSRCVISDVAELPDCQKHWRAEGMSSDAFRGSNNSKRIPFSAVNQFGRIKAPMLIVVGDDDVTCSPAAAQQLHLRIPDSDLLLIEGAGRFPWLERPEALFSGARSFLPALVLGQ